MTDSGDKGETITIHGSGSDQPAAEAVTVLLFHRGGVAVQQLPTGVRLVVGRGPADLELDDPALSRRHATLTAQEGSVTIEDLGSKNGVHVNDRRVDRANIAPGDDVRLGVVSLRLVLGEGLAPERLPDHETLLAELERAIVHARLYRHQLALTLVRAIHPARNPIGSWFLEARSACADDEFLALYDRATLEVLAPRATADDALTRARRLARAGIDSGAPLCCGLAVFPDAAASAEELVTACREALARAELDEPVSVAPASNALAPFDDSPPVFLGAKTRALYETVERIAPSDLPVLVQGETGTGKELLARAIHHASPRCRRPLSSINCAAIPEHLVESELFGHERGAFTGADRQRAGLFEEADGGTVLLDEVGELSAQAQASLLRVLEAGRFCRVGGAGNEIAVDVRVIAATNRDLEVLCSEGGFRQDLLFRLNAVTLCLPPLRDRPEEIRPLAELFLSGGGQRVLAPEALALLERYRWPGNVRELRNVIERATVIARGERITAEDLPERVRNAGERADGDEVQDFRQRIQRYEMELILEALRATGWNQSEAARRLHMPLRTMVRKIQTYGLRDRQPDRG
jgi:DNA-binding NtrC family response regulator